MAFNENPKVDNASEQSEQSVLAVRSLLSQRNGFISRDEIPDFGVDLRVELVQDGQASGCHFVVQIKSSKTLPRTTVGDEKFVSYQFPTSRLGYLCRSQPGYGLVILYDDSSGVAFYDYVEDIYQRACTNREPQVWQRQETVSIQIPATNVLCDESAARIHERYRVRFSNYELLVKQHGQDFGLPLLLDGIPTAQSNTRPSPGEIAEFIEKYGSVLFNQHDFRFLIELLEEIPPRFLNKSANLAFTAALAYSESGFLWETEYYIRKAEARWSRLTEEQCTLIKLCRSKLEFRLGRLDLPAHLEELSDLKSTASIETTRLSLSIYATFLRTLAIIRNAKVTTIRQLVQDVKLIQKEVQESGLEVRQKQLLLLTSATILHQLGLSLTTALVTRLNVRADILGSARVPMHQRLESATESLDVLFTASEVLRKVKNELTDSKEDKPIALYLGYRSASMAFASSFHSFMLSGESALGVADSGDPLRQEYQRAILAYNGLVEIGALDAAYASLGTAVEIMVLHQQFSDIPLPGPSREEVEERMKVLESKLSRPRFSSVVESFLADRQNRVDRSLGQIPVEHQKDYARLFVEAMGLPEERMGNVLSDIRAYGEFERAFPDGAMMLRQNLRHAESTDTMYREPVVYVAECTRCGFRSVEGEDVVHVIADCFTRHGRECA